MKENIIVNSTHFSFKFQKYQTIINNGYVRSKIDRRCKFTKPTAVKLKYFMESLYFPLKKLFNSFTLENG